MKKILLIFTSILFLLCLSSCNYPPETSSEEIQTLEETQNQEESLSQEESQDPDSSLMDELISMYYIHSEMINLYIRDRPVEVIFTMDGYNQFLETNSIPENFIRYQQVSFFGTLRTLIIALDHQYQMYFLQNGKDEFCLLISPLTSSEPPTSENESNQENEIVNQPNSDLRHLPNKETGVYRYHDIQYHYQQGNLIWMDWVSHEIQYLLICSPCWSDYELDNPIINNFLNKDTAEQAIQAFDEMLNSSADR